MNFVILFWAGVMNLVSGKNVTASSSYLPQASIPIAPGAQDNCCIVVLGASGDLAFKKTYPALFGLYKNGHLPARLQVVGYARSKIELGAFKARISSKIKLEGESDRVRLEEFLNLCFYSSGLYDDSESFNNLNRYISALEGDVRGSRDRVFYMALPPSVFVPASVGLRDHVYSESGQNRLIVEKPFGKDTDSSLALGKALANKWSETEVYRIDHYLGKEMVKNLMHLRFANVFFGAIWNRQHIHNVQITFKEPFGTEGRGGYFDEFGIIRDVIQNHLLQVLTIIAMDKPVTLHADDVRSEKVKVLRAIQPLTVNDVVLGQYTKSSDGQKPGYLDDDTVPRGSNTPTFAAAVLRIDNERWEGVPFIIKAGKALNEQKVEIRIQMREVPGSLYPHVERNELVIRIQPQEAVYLKFTNKQPGLASTSTISELDLSYHQRYPGAKIPDAYEALILDALKGDKSNFVRDDELDAAWKIFTPLLHTIEKEKIQPLPYSYGSRGPEQVKQFVERLGYVRQPSYMWSPAKF